MREIVERETLETSHAVGKSVSDWGEWERCGPQGRSFLDLFCRDALFLLQVNISLLLLDKTLEEGSSLGCVIALERYSGVRLRFSQHVLSGKADWVLWDRSGYNTCILLRVFSVLAQLGSSMLRMLT